MAVMTVGNAEHTLDRTNRAAHTGADRATNHAAHGTGDPVTLIGAFLGAAYDALGVAGLGQRQQGEQEGGGCEQQTGGHTGRRLGSGDTSFVHLRSRGDN